MFLHENGKYSLVLKIKPLYLQPRFGKRLEQKKLKCLFCEKEGVEFDRQVILSLISAKPWRDG